MVSLRSSLLLFLLGVWTLTLYPLVLSEDYPYNEVISLSSIESDKRTCPGLYCGRTKLGDDQLGICGACPRGQRPNSSSICTPCTNQPTSYDWMYFAFMAIFSLTLNLLFIAIYVTKNSLAMYIMTFSETAIAFIFTILLTNPMGSMRVDACAITGLSDWYTMLYNPRPDYTNTLHCTQEVVYPLYTMVFVFYALLLLLVLALRSSLVHKLCGKRASKSTYAILYCLPTLAVVHALLAGLIYSSYPYIIIICSLVTGVLDLVNEQVESPRELFSKTTSVARLLYHWALHTFGLVALTQLAEPLLHGLILLLVPLPTSFYFLTIKFTDPDNILR